MHEIYTLHGYKSYISFLTVHRGLHGKLADRILATKVLH